MRPRRPVLRAVIAKAALSQRRALAKLRLQEEARKAPGKKAAR